MIELVLGDITQETTDAIVNAANCRLAGGGGVDGAIHRAGGPDIMQELREKYAGCPTGSAVITGAGKLKAKYVIHAVGPVYSGKERDEALLSSAYEASLKLCLEYKARSVAFPSISTGAYRYPVEKAAPIALRAICDFLKEQGAGAPKVRFVLFDKSALEAYVQTYSEMRF